MQSLDILTNNDWLDASFLFKWHILGQMRAFQPHFYAAPIIFLTQTRLQRQRSFSCLYIGPFLAYLRVIVFIDFLYLWKTRQCKANLCELKLLIVVKFLDTPLWMFSYSQYCRQFKEVRNLFVDHKNYQDGCRYLGQAGQD